MATRGAGESPRPMIFGTDGVRDRAGEGFLTPESVERLAAATAFVLAERARFPEDFPAGRGRAVVLARDTRASGPVIAAGLARVLAGAGHEVLDAGVLPTPGVAAVSAA